MPAPTSRTEVKRVAERGVYDRTSIESILDEGYLCHVGIVQDGSPVVIPMLYARDGDSILIHGSPASRILRAAKSDGLEICLTVTLIDGFVIARSAFHHSMNYRSVVVFGQAVPISDEAERRVALDKLVDTLVPGQVPYVRGTTDKEAKGTLVLRLSLDEASAKVRTGPPKDEPEDYDLPIWAGVIPVTETYGSPMTDPELGHDLTIPRHLLNYSRRRA